MFEIVAMILLAILTVMMAGVGMSKHVDKAIEKVNKNGAVQLAVKGFTTYRRIKHAVDTIKGIGDDYKMIEEHGALGGLQYLNNSKTYGGQLTDKYDERDWSNGGGLHDIYRTLTGQDDKGQNNDDKMQRAYELALKGKFSVEDYRAIAKDFKGYRGLNDVKIIPVEKILDDKGNELAGKAGKTDSLKRTIEYKTKGRSKMQRLYTVLHEETELPIVDYLQRTHKTSSQDELDAEVEAKLYSDIKSLADLQDAGVHTGRAEGIYHALQGYQRQYWEKLEKKNPELVKKIKAKVEKAPQYVIVKRRPRAL